MSDPRTTGKGSRTAAVVMLVVFVQVLIVAVLGLGAIGRDADAAKNQAALEAADSASRAMATIIKRSRAEVLFALRDVRNRPRFRDLEFLRDSGGHGRHLDLIGVVYQVDPQTREILWMDGETRLYVPGTRREVLIDQTREPSVDDRATSLYEDYRSGTGPGRLSNGLAFCRHFPYRQDGEGYPQALGAAHSLIPLADELTQFSDFDEQEQAWLNLEETLLRAIEVRALNKDRKEDIPKGDQIKFELIDEAVDSAIAALLLEQPGIGRHVEACRDARRRLEGPPSLLRVIEVALAAMGETEDVTYVADRLVGLIPHVQVPGATGSVRDRHFLVMLNVAAVKHLVEEIGEQERVELLDPLGLELKLVDRGEPLEGSIAAHHDLRDVSGLRIPYRVELHRVRASTVPVGGPGAPFYWGIIALSAAGLGVGGWVLMRLYTREVRLARLKADFVSNLSHELKTPLTSIGLWTEMLQSGALESDEDQAEGIGILTQEAERLQEIVHRMLDTAKREARGVAYELSPGDLNEVVGAAAERFRRITAEPGLELEIDLHPEPIPVQMDRAAIDDMVSNLVSNAWKYKRGNEVRVEVRTVRRGRKATVTVADNGLGIPRRERGKVFEMFYRAEAYLTRAAGTGLGLSLVRTIVKGHRGSIRIENGLEGRGSTFRIRLPVSKFRGPSEAQGSMSGSSEAKTSS